MSWVQGNLTKNDTFPEIEVDRKDSLRTKAEYVSALPASLPALPYTAFLPLALAYSFVFF